MVPVIYNFRLDASKSGSQIGLVMKAGDRSSRKLRVALVNGTSSLPLNGGESVSFKALKPDGTAILDTCEVVNGLVEHEVSDQTLAVEGTVACEMICYSASGEVLCTPAFEIYAEGKVYPDDVIESSNEFNTLTDALVRVNEVELNEAERIEAEEERQTTTAAAIASANRAAARAEAAADAYDQLIEGSDYPPHASTHAIGGHDSITPEMIGAQPAGSYIEAESDPTVPAWAKAQKKPTYGAEEVGAAPAVHAHGNITGAGRVGTDGGKVIVTGSGGAVEAATPAEALAVIGAQPLSMVVENVAVPVELWASDNTYGTYPYRAAVPVEGVTERQYAEVNFAPAESDSGSYSSTAATYDGGVYIYAASIPAAAITIASIKIDAVGSEPIEGTESEQYYLPIADANTLGGVQPVTKTETMTQPVGVDGTGALYTAPGSGSGYELPVASSTTLGGVQPATKTDDMTQPVGVDAAGALFTAPGGGGGGEWKLLRSFTLPEDASADTSGIEWYMSAREGYEDKIHMFMFDTDSNGLSFSIRELFAVINSGNGVSGAGSNYWGIGDQNSTTGGYQNLFVNRNKLNATTSLVKWAIYIKTVGPYSFGLLSANDRYNGAMVGEFEARTDEPITAIRFGSFPDQAMLIGSTFEFYGR